MIFQNYHLFLVFRLTRNSRKGLENDALSLFANFERVLNSSFICSWQCSQTHKKLYFVSLAIPETYYLVQYCNIFTGILQLFQRMTGSLLSINKLKRFLDQRLIDIP